MLAQVRGQPSIPGSHIKYRIETLCGVHAQVSDYADTELSVIITDPKRQGRHSGGAKGIGGLVKNAGGRHRISSFLCAWARLVQIL